MWCRKRSLPLERGASPPDWTGEAPVAQLAHHGENANRRGLARLLDRLLCRRDDDERAGRRQCGEARRVLHDIASMERELPRQVTVGGEVHGRLDGKADGVASVDEELSRVTGDGK